MKFLKKISDLEEELSKTSPEVQQKGFQYCAVLKFFREVVHSCFGNQLIDGYREKLALFKDAYAGLGISTTPKVG